MATYLVKEGGRIITNVFYGAQEFPKVGDFLRLTVTPDASDWLGISAPSEPAVVVFQITDIGHAASGLQDEGHVSEPTIFVERR